MVEEEVVRGLKEKEKEGVTPFRSKEIEKGKYVKLVRRTESATFSLRTESVVVD